MWNRTRNSSNTAALALMAFAALSLPALADREADDDARQAAYRVGSAASKLALLPVKCGRDIDAALCLSIDESLATHIARDPRIDVITPKDLEVLMGAQQLVELTECEGASCFDPAAFTQVEATYLVSAGISRIGGDATITMRLIDLKRGVVIDRDDARAWRGSEAGIDEATRALATTMLVRRGVATPPAEIAEDDGGNPGLFWGGAGALGLGVVGLGAGGVLGALAYSEVNQLGRTPGLTQEAFNDASGRITLLGAGADGAMIAGGALAVVGVSMLILGSF
jgi:hypothetical protein